MQPVGQRAEHATTQHQEAAASGGVVLPRLLRKPVRRLQRIANGGIRVTGRGLAIAGFAVAFVASGAGLAGTQNGHAMLADLAPGLGLSIERYDISGNSAVSDIEVVALLAPRAGQPIFLFDVEDARRKLTTNAWIAEAQVTKVYPDTLSVRLIERQPFALWQNEDGLQIIDRQGRVLAAHDGRDLDLPLVVGKGAEEAAAGMLAQLGRHRELAGRTTALIRVGGRRWDIEFDNGVSVRLPEGDPASALAELARLERDEALLARAVRTIDLRIAGQLTLELDEDAAEIVRTRREEQIRALKDAGKGRAI